MLRGLDVNAHVSRGSFANNRRLKPAGEKSALREKASSHILSILLNYSVFPGPCKETKFVSR